jgi:hypothetical protein
MGVKLEKNSHMVFSIIFLEDKHKIVLHLSIFYEYQQFFQHRICFSIQPTLTTHGKKMHVKEIYVIFIHLFDSGILLIIDLSKKKKGGSEFYL